MDTTSPVFPGGADASASVLGPSAQMGLIERSLSLAGWDDEMVVGEEEKEEQEVDFSTIVAYLDALLRVGPWGGKHPRRLRLQTITTLIRRRGIRTRR